LELLQAQDKLLAQLRQRREKKLRLRKVFQQQARRTTAAVEAELDVLDVLDPESDFNDLMDPLVLPDGSVEVSELPPLHSILERPIESWMLADNLPSNFFETPVGEVGSSTGA
jgi:hypothetical protein